MDGTVALDRGTLDLDSGTILGTSTRLSATERAVVRFLCALDGPCDPRTLLREVWGYREGVRSRTVYSTVDRLRKKIEVDPRQPRHLVTVDEGYLFIPASTELECPSGTYGRDADLATLSRLLDAGGLVGIHGPGGVGKTHLAEVALEACAARFREVLRVDLRGVSTAEEAEGRLRRALDVRGTEPGALAAAVRAREPVLILLDDLDDLEEEAQELLGALEPGPERVFLLTSRRRIRSVEALPLEPLEPWAGVALFRALTDSQASDDALESIVEHLDRLPLALEVAAPWLEPLGVERLVENRKHLGALRTCILRSWERLGTVQRDLLGGLAWVGGRAPIDLAMALSPEAGLGGVRALEAASLLRVRDGWVETLPTVCEVVASQVEPDAERVRALTWAARRCAEVGRSLGGPAESACVRTVRLELDVLLTVLQRAERGPTWRRAVLDLAPVVWRVGLADALDAWLGHVVAHAADASEEWLGRARQGEVVLRRGGDVLRLLEGLDAVEVDPHVRGEVLFVKASALHRQGAFQEALATLRDLGALQLGNVRVVRQALHLEARVHGALLKHDDLLRAVGELERLAGVAGDLPAMARAAAMRGVHARDQGEPFQAEVFWRKGRALAVDAEDFELGAHLTESVAAALLTQERDAEARRLLAEAQRFYTRHGMIGAEGFVLLALGGIDLYGGNDAGAEEQFLHATNAFSASGFQRGVAAARGMLGRLYTGQGRLEKAEAAYDGVLDALGSDAGERSIHVVRALRALCRIQRGDQADLAWLRTLGDEAPFGFLKELAEASATQDAEAHERVRSVVRSRELDRAGLSV